MADISPPPINAQPAGLLSFFGIKNLGQNPKFLVGNVQPVVDLWEMYVTWQGVQFLTFSDILAADTPNQVNNIPSTTPTDLGNGAAILVPQDEYWWLYDVATVWTFANVAGQQCDAQCQYNSFTSSVPPTTLAGFTSSAVGSTRGGSRQWTEGRLVPPGSSIRQRIYGALVAASTISVQSTMRLVRMRA